MSERPRLLVALVLTGDDATEVDGLRRALGAGALGRIPPHVTLVAPLNVAAEQLDAVDAHLLEVAARFSPVLAELGPVGTFAPRTPVVYLEVHEPGEAGSQLGDLADALANGPLSPPARRHARGFVAHVTLGANLAPEILSSACLVLGAYRRRVVFDRLVLFRQDSKAPRQPWRPIADYRFGADHRTGRGGRELSFGASEHVSPSAEEFLAREAEALGAAGAPAHGLRRALAFEVRTAGEVVALARGARRDTSLVIDEILVARAHRNEGIGSQLVSFIERYAREESLAAIEVSGQDEAVRALFRARGYLEVPGGLPHLRRALLRQDLDR